MNADLNEGVDCPVNKAVELFNKKMDYPNY